MNQNRLANYSTYEYENNIRHATILLNKNPRAKQFINAEDVVHEALLYCRNGNIASFIRSKVIRESQRNQRIHPHKKTHRCTKCGETKPLSSFYIHIEKHFNCQYPNSRCRTCVNISSTSPEYKERKREYQRRNPETNRARQRRYWHKEKELLSDKWIIKCIRRYNKSVTITDEMLSEWRKRIQLRRAKSAAKQLIALNPNLNSRAMERIRSVLTKTA